MTASEVKPQSVLPSMEFHRSRHTGCETLCVIFGKVIVIALVVAGIQMGMRTNPVKNV